MITSAKQQLVRTYATVGTLYTGGYASPPDAARVGRLMHQETRYLVDIRRSPRSR
ncbi:MAG: hypothetical protein J2P37_09500 [Ktedonobacteraceae bacterium]|nr:hypothetical protein [Ktedonobacteraceae bacterium]